MTAPRQRPSTPAVSQELVEWLAGGERGISSNTIVEWLTGIECVLRPPMSHPHDPGDLARCVKLLEQCPELRPRLGEMAGLSREWAALVEVWDELVAMLDEEVPDWRLGQWRSSTHTYRRMRELIEGARL